MTEPATEPVAIRPLRALGVLAALLALALPAAHVLLAGLPDGSWSLKTVRELIDVGRARSLPSWLLAQLLLVGALLAARRALLEPRRAAIAPAASAALLGLASLDRVAGLHSVVPVPMGGILALAALAFAGMAVPAAGARRLLLLAGAALLLAGAAAGAGTLHDELPSAPAQALAPAFAAALALAGALTGTIGLGARLHREGPHARLRFV